MALEIEHIIGNTYFVNSAVCVGLYVQNNEVILIDTGADKDFARQLQKSIKDKGWILKLVINTHFHADHIGGNAYLKNNTDCKIISTQIESAFIKDTLLEPSFLNGGYFLDKHKTKFLMAKNSDVDSVIMSGGVIFDTDLVAVPLGGHSFDMIGIKTLDDVFFVADSVFSEDIIKKYHLSFMYDVDAQLKTLDFLKNDSSSKIVLSHGGVVNDFKGLIDLNLSKINEILGLICIQCTESGKTIEELLKIIFDHYGLAMNEVQYVLNLSSLRSYLSYLCNVGRLEYKFVENKMIYLNKLYEII